MKLIVCFRQTQTHTLPPSNNIPNFISSVYQSLSTSLLPSPLFSSYPLSFLLSPSFSLFLHPSTDLRADRSLRRGVRHLVAGHKPRLLLGVCRLIRVLLSVIMRSEPAAIGERRVRGGRLHVGRESRLEISEEFVWWVYHRQGR